MMAEILAEEARAKDALKVFNIFFSYKNVHCQICSAPIYFVA